MNLRTLSLLTVAALSLPALAATALNDAQITQVVMTVDKGEAELGKLAKETTKNSEVKAFAEHMMKDHSEGQKKAQELSKKLSLTPQESEKSTTMKKEGDLTKARLMSLTGNDFDKAYINSQVNAHQKVLDGINKELLPSAKNEELKMMLEKKRTTVTQHLNHAKQVQAKM